MQANNNFLNSIPPFNITNTLNTFAMRYWKLLPGILFLSGLLFILTSGLASAQQNEQHAKLVIVMDDIGYNLPLGKRAAELPGAITYAIIPHTPLARKLAFYALHKDTNKEIIVHMPMQPTNGKTMGDGGLSEKFDQQEFLQTLRLALDDVPFARGLSNHMGSQLTTLPDRMDWLMQELAANNYFFLDSRTTSLSATRNAALNFSVPYLARDVFLDHDRSPEAIAAAFDQALNLARQQGSAVLLAHPYPTTLEFLERRLPNIEQSGIELITASTALNFGQAQSATDRRLAQRSNPH